MNFGLVLNRIREVLMAVFSNGESLAKIKRRLDDIEHRQIQQGDAITRIESVQHDQSQLLIILNRTIAAAGVKIANVEDILNKLLVLVELPPTTASIDRIVTFRGQILEGVDTLQIKDDEQFDITLANPKDAKGQPSTIDPSKTVFNIDNPFATLTPGTDGLSCNVKGATVGSAQISGSVTDANNPADVVPFTPLHLDVIASDTVTIDVTTGPVTKQ